MKACSEDYYRRAIEWWKDNKENEGGKDEEKKKNGGTATDKTSEPRGKITVNGKNVDTDYEIKDGDRIVHEITREETPVIQCDINVIQDATDFIVVNKPSSMPVHPCGNFKHNSLQGILENEMGFGKIEAEEDHEETKKQKKSKGKPKAQLLTVHRLDRQTSGIVFFAKNDKASNRFRELMQSNEISKVYYARVHGDFSKCQGLDKQTSEVTIENKIYQISFIDSLWECNDPENVPYEHKQKAKEAKTRFKFKFYDEKSNTSVIKCYPVTGRTHQIRVHLKYLGFPIANDQMYFTGITEE